MAEVFQIITGISEMVRSELSEAARSQQAARNQQAAQSELSEMARTELGEHKLNFVITFYNERSNNETSSTLNLTDDMILKIIRSIRGCPKCGGECCPTSLPKSFLKELDELGGSGFDLGMAVFDTHTRPILFVPEQGKMPDMYQLLGRITIALLGT